MSSETAITVRDLSKVYELGLTGRSDSLLKIMERRMRHPFARRPKPERMKALDGLTFDVHPGEAVGVIGKNGAGKSTLLKILSRITPPSDGYIEMVGNVGSLLEVGTGFHPELTGLENVYLNGTILGMSRREIDRRLDEIVDFSEVHRFLDTPVKRYSSGMRVRLAFSVAAHLDPEVLIVDEVLSVGDYSFQAKCLERMRNISTDEGRTVLYVSHNLVTLEHLCPRALLLVDGQLVFDGETSETLAKYVSMAPRARAGDEAGVFDLAAADRSGGHYHAELFRRLELRPDGGQPAATLFMGQRLQIAIDVEGLEALVQPNVTVGFGTGPNDVLFRLSSRMVPLEAAHPRCRDETILIDIPSLALTPGDYVVNVAIFDLRSAHLIDEVLLAAQFTVIPVDVLGTGYQYNAAKDGHFVVPFDWEIRPADSQLLDTDGSSGAALPEMHG